MQKQVLSMWAPGSRWSCKRYNCEKGPEVKFWLTETESWPQLKSWQGRLLAFCCKYTHVWKHTRIINRQKCMDECRDKIKTHKAKQTCPYSKAQVWFLFKSYSLCYVSASQFCKVDTPKKNTKEWESHWKVAAFNIKKSWRDYWCKTCLMDIPESCPSARHPTKSLFTAQLRVGHKCYTVLMMQRFKWIFWFRLFCQHFPLWLTLTEKMRCQTICPHIKTGIV